MFETAGINQSPSSSTLMGQKFQKDKQDKPTELEALKSLWNKNNNTKFMLLKLHTRIKIKFNRG